jgi:hypothetical protein
MSEAFGGVSYMDYRLVGGLLLGRVYVIKCLRSMNALRELEGNLIHPEGWFMGVWNARV